MKLFRFPAKVEDDESISFEGVIEGLGGLPIDEVLDRLAPGTELELGDDGLWRIVEAEAR